MPVTARNEHKAELRLERELARLAWRLRARSVLWGLLAFGAALGAGGAAMVLIHPLLADRMATAGLLALAWALLALAALGRLVLAPLFSRLPPARILAALEKDHPELRDRLSTALYLYRSEEVDHYGFSPDLVRATLAFAEARADLGELRAGFSWRPLRTPAAWCGLVVAAWAGLALAPQAWLRPALSQYRAAVLGEMPLPAPVRFTTSGDLYVRKGQPVEVGARLLSGERAPLLLELEGPDGRRQILSGQARDATTVFVVPPLSSDHVYRVFSGGHFSGAHQLTVLTAPRITRWHWTLTPPAYTRKPESRISTPARRVSAPGGSWGELAAETNWPIARVETAGGLLNLRLSPEDPRALLGSMEFASAAPVVVTLHDVFGQVASETLEVGLVADEPPEVVISFPPRAYPLPDKAGELRLEWSATDDYGVLSATLALRINSGGAAEERVALYGPGVAAGTVESTTMGVRGGYLWNLSPLRLLPGDEVHYWIEASDNRPAPDGPNLGRSAVHVLKLPSLLEQYAEKYQSEAAQVESMEDLLEQQRALQQRVGQIREKLEEKERNVLLGRERPESAWEEQKALEELKKDQEALARQMERLREELAQSLAGAEERERSLRTAEKEKKIRELLDQLLDDRTKAMLNQMQQAIDELARKMDAQRLEALELDMRQYEEELDRALAQLHNLYTERQVEEMAERAEELAEAQREITERTQDARDLGEEEASKEELARQEEFLAQELADLAEQLERLAEWNAEENPERAEMLEQAAQELRESGLSEDVEKAMQELRQERFSESLQSQQSAQGKLDRLAARMQEMQEAMGGQDLQMDIAKIGAVARRALYLSHRHEATVVGPLYDLSRLGSWSDAGQRTLRRDMDTHRAETLRLRALLEEAMRDVPFVEDRAVRLLAAVVRNLTQAIRAADDPRPAAAQPNANQSLRFLNETVRELLNSLDQMQQMQQPGGTGGDESGELQQRLEELAQRQRGLNQRRERLQAAPRQRPGWQEMMDRMAEEQRAIRQELEGMAEQLEQSKELLGDMGAVADEMQEVEELLREHNPDDPRIKEKQEHILEKLLEGGKSLQEEDYKKERESEVAREYVRPEILDRPGAGRDLQRSLLRRAESLEDENLLPRLRLPASNYFRNLAEEI